MAIAVTLLEGSDDMVVGYCDDACTNLDLAHLVGLPLDGLPFVC